MPNKKTIQRKICAGEFEKVGSHLMIIYTDKQSLELQLLNLHFWPLKISVRPFRVTLGDHNVCCSGSVLSTA